MQDTFRVLSLPKLLDIYNQGSEGDNKKDAELACMYQLSTIEGQLQLIDMRIKNLKDLGDDATAIRLIEDLKNEKNDTDLLLERAMTSIDMMVEQEQIQFASLVYQKLVADVYDDVDSQKNYLATRSRLAP